MAEGTNISWCDDTVNFWSGCTKVSTGCANCYADALSARFDTFGKWGKGAPRKLHESAFKLAHRLNKKPWVCDECGTTCTASNGEGLAACPKCECTVYAHRRRIFSLSMGDWLDPEVLVEWLARMLDTIRQCDQVTWVLCTKRPELFHERMQSAVNHLERMCAAETWLRLWIHEGEPLPNIWLLASVENQEMADKRIPELLRIPAAVRGLSCEPLLGPIIFDYAVSGDVTADWSSKGLRGINWVIVGGESGPKKARPCNIEWIRSLVQQGKAAGCATFVKQLGAFTYEDHGTGQFESRHRLVLNHPKGGDPSEWPEDLRIQEHPKQTIDNT